MGLPAALDVDLELRMPGPDCLQERTELRFLVAGQERQDASRLDEEPFDDGGGDVVEARSARDRAVVDEAEEVADPHRDPVQLRIA